MKHLPQAGQALIEMLVVLTLLIIPLMFLIRLIGSLLYQQQGMELAARYTVWERAVWSAHAPGAPAPDGVVKSDAVLAAEVDVRIFAAPDQTPSAENETLRLDPFLRGIPGTTSGTLLRPTDDAGATRYSQVESQHIAPAGAVGLVDDIVAVLGGLTRFDLSRDGVAQTTVAVQLSPLNDAIGLALPGLETLRLRRSAALFVGHWTAGGTAQAASRISGLLPQQFLDHSAVRDAQQFVAYAPIAEELDEDRLRFGHVTLEPLPAYRLGPTAPSP